MLPDTSDRRSSRLRLLRCLAGSSVLVLLACSSSTESSPAGSGGASPAGSGGALAEGGASTAGHSGRSTGGASDAGGPGGGSEPRGGTGDAGSDTGGMGSGGSRETGDGEFGFSYRAPGADNLDWLCTFNQDSDSGHVYVRLLQTGTTQVGIGKVPVYEVELAQISLGGEVSALTSVNYDHGGGHNNDSITFDFGGKTHTYYHSSFGFGFRKCQNMDCRNVYAAGTTTLETEGCDSNRTLPEVCVSFKPDGTHDALVDKFMKCPGDAQ